MYSVVWYQCCTALSVSAIFYWLHAMHHNCQVLLYYKVQILIPAGIPQCKCSVVDSIIIQEQRDR